MKEKMSESTAVQIGHTPLPWVQGEKHRIEHKTDGGGATVVAMEHSIGDYRDRKFILQAVNSHYELLEACKAVRNAFIHIPGDGAGNKVRTAIFKHCENMREAAVAVRNALAKATGESEAQ